MISLERRIEALVKLGSWLKNYGIWKAQNVHEDNSQWTELDMIVRNHHIYNHWLIEPFVEKAIEHWAERLSFPSIQLFANRYPELENKQPTISVVVIPKKNIPLAGLHDAVCILLAGHCLLARNTNHELDLLKCITHKLITIEPAFEELICWVDTFPKSTDAYLVHSKPEEDAAIKQYFSAKCSLIRSKCISVAVLKTDFKSQEIEALSGDILDFFGQSDHNVRKIYVPANFNVEQFYPFIEGYAWMQQNNRYANNFDYHRSIFLMDRIEFFENGFLILRESAEMHVPIGCLYFEYYTSMVDLTEKLCTYKHQIQQVICKSDLGIDTMLPGSAHNYPLWNFDDNQDVMSFLLKR